MGETRRTPSGAESFRARSTPIMLGAHDGSASTSLNLYAVAKEAQGILDGSSESILTLGITTNGIEALLQNISQDLGLGFHVGEVSVDIHDGQDGANRLRLSGRMKVGMIPLPPMALTLRNDDNGTDLKLDAGSEKLVMKLRRIHFLRNLIPPEVGDFSQMLRAELGSFFGGVEVASLQIGERGLLARVQKVGQQRQLRHVA